MDTTFISALAVLYSICCSIFIFLSKDYGLWGWGLEPGGDLKMALTLIAYGILITIATYGPTGEKKKIGITITGLCLTLISTHFYFFGTYGLRSVHGASSFLNPAFYALSALTITLAIGLLINKSKPAHEETPNKVV